MLNERVNLFGRSFPLWAVVLVGAVVLLLFVNHTIAEWIAYLIIIFISFPVHEIAHAYVADYYGDMTPRLAGRITLNPFAHIDWMGAALLVVMGFGWAKPVPVNEHALSQGHPQGPLFTALAGPFSNFGLAFIGAVIARGLLVFSVGGAIASFVFAVLVTFVQINLFLMLFNLVPLFLLDGEKVLLHLLPVEMRRPLLLLRRYNAMPLLIFLLLAPRTGLFSLLIVQPMNWLTTLLVGL